MNETELHLESIELALKSKRKAARIRFIEVLCGTIDRLHDQFCGTILYNAAPATVTEVHCISSPADDSSPSKMSFSYKESILLTPVSIVQNLLIVIGPNGTGVDEYSFKTVPWSSPAAATRSLMSLVFSEDILATHTLTGRPLAAFHGQNHPTGLQLDPQKVEDIVHCIKIMCFVSRERSIHFSISLKCAEAAKRRLRQAPSQ